MVLNMRHPSIYGQNGKVSPDVHTMSQVTVTSCRTSHTPAAPTLSALLLMFLQLDLRVLARLNLYRAWFIYNKVLVKPRGSTAGIYCRLINNNVI